MTTWTNFVAAARENLGFGIGLTTDLYGYRNNQGHIPPASEFPLGTKVKILVGNIGPSNAQPDIHGFTGGHVVLLAEVPGGEVLSFLPSGRDEDQVGGADYPEIIAYPSDPQASNHDVAHLTLNEPGAYCLYAAMAPTPLPSPLLAELAACHEQPVSGDLLKSFAAAIGGQPAYSYTFTVA